MENLKEVQNILPDLNRICFVVRSLFSKTECEQILNSEIKASFQDPITHYPSHYRNNERLVLDNEPLANRLFEKVQPYLPPIFEVSSNIESENGIWSLKELKSRLRFCKYSANQFFSRHLDGIYYNTKDYQSKLTFVIYLNGAIDFEGGRTLFFRTKESEDIWAAYVPEEGDLLIFDHNVWHEGEMLTKGEKFVLRSDIIYVRDSREDAQEPFAGHLGYVWSLLKLNDNCLLSGGRDTIINQWTPNGKLQQSLTGHSNSVLCIEKMDERTFISGSRDMEIIVWCEFKIVHRILIHSAVVLSLCRIDNGTFASGGGDSLIRIAKLDGTVLKTFTGHNNWVWQILALADNVIASCSEDGSIKIWDIAFTEPVCSFDDSEPVLCLAYNSTTRQLISGTLSGTISIRTLSDSYKLQRRNCYKAHSGAIRTVKVIDDGRIASGGEDSKVKIWCPYGELQSVFEQSNFVQSIEVMSSETILSASYDGTIKVWNLEGSKEISE